VTVRGGWWDGRGAGAGCRVVGGGAWVGALEGRVEVEASSWSLDGGEDCCGGGLEGWRDPSSKIHEMTSHQHYHKRT